jgi:hypothetical protein
VALAMGWLDNLLTTTHQPLHLHTYTYAFTSTPTPTPTPTTTPAGNRSKQVTAACKKYGGFYLGSIGGPAAILAKNCIKKVSLLLIAIYLDYAILCTRLCFHICPFYLGSIGGPAAILAKNCFKKGIIVSSSLYSSTLFFLKMQYASPIQSGGGSGDQSDLFYSSFYLS